ncbi:hypothetical protein [Alkalibacter saccharofermentans]|uniref:DUF5673 domain-containing protein n=1 Tax=Alkalibacter saccharofermentans DSM 14828 TaxID=1120975 RepID=A0A1M4SQ09_9FIRM|nr:hypothetical protein [Alkalibacter saccharofermentans]SHE34037.1 hypothetical protein SAMN02746064_00330 [Alkalibacter saccharofermentans DSM 14828]
MDDIKNLIYILIVTLITIQSLVKIGVTEYKRKNAGKCLEQMDKRFDVKGIFQLGIYYLFSQGLINVIAQGETSYKIEVTTLYINVIMTIIAITTVYFSMMDKGVYENGVAGDYGIIFWDEIKEWEITNPNKGNSRTIKIHSKKNRVIKRIKIKASKTIIAKMEKILKKQVV